MTKKQIQALIDTKTQKMDEYKAIRDMLKTNLTTITDSIRSLDDGVYLPISAPYPLGGDGEMDWAGDGKADAEELNNEISLAMSAYEGEVDTLMGEISKDISDVEEKISEIRKEIIKLVEALLVAPDDEVEGDTYAIQ